MALNEQPDSALRKHQTNLFNMAFRSGKH